MATGEYQSCIDVSTLLYSNSICKIESQVGVLLSTDHIFTGYNIGCKRACLRLHMAANGVSPEVINMLVKAWQGRDVRLIMMGKQLSIIAQGRLPFSIS